MTSISASHRLLLDTNVAIWLLLGNRSAVSASAQEALQDPRHELLLSAVTVWEIAIKRSLGKLDIDPSWARELLRLDLVQLPVTAEHARRVESLPWHHRDPFDRLLVAQAVAEQCPLITADTRMGAYDVSIVW